jgi:membrane protein DedA with SNARE-associated domain
MRLGQYIFRQHGIWVVMFGQFFPVIRALAALLAGANHVKWRPFWGASVAGALLWSGLFGFGSYWVGKSAQHWATSIDVAFLVAAAVIFAALALYFHKNEERLQRQADQFGT